MSISRQSSLVRMPSLDRGQVLVIEAKMPFSVVNTLESVVSSSLITMSRESLNGDLTKHAHGSSALGSLLRLKNNRNINNCFGVFKI